MKKDSKYAKKIKYGTMAAIITAFVVAIVIVVNIIMGILTERYPMKLDLTKDKRYELCDESINVLKNLEKDVEIAVMFPEESLLQYEYYNMIPKILEKRAHNVAYRSQLANAVDRVNVFGFIEFYKSVLFKCQSRAVEV